MTTAEPSTRPVRDPANPQTPPKSEGGSFLGNFRIGTKLTLATIVLVIPLGVVVGLLANQQNQDIAFAQKERSGVVYLTPLRNFLQELQKHRGSSNGLLNGDASFQKTVTASATAADTALTALEAAPQLAGNAFGLSEDVSTLKTNWQQLRRAVDSRTLSAPQSFQRHTTLVNNILTLIDTVGNRSNLILDPSLDSFYTMNAVVNVLPDLTEFIGQARGNTARISTQNQISSADRVLIEVLVAQAKTLSENLVTSYGFAAEANPSVKAQLTAASNSATQNVDTLLALYTREIIQNSGAPRSGTSLFIAATQSLDELFKLHAQTTGVLDRLISDRINTLNRNLFVTLLLVLLGVALAILLVVLVVRSITRPVGQLVRVVEKVGQGDLGQKAAVTTSDEIGVLARQVNSSIDLLRDTAKRNEVEQQRSATLQNNIGEFLNVTMDISSGDLTKRGKVSEDVLGNVVDSINVMTEELGYTLKDVRNVSNDVSNSSGSVLLSTQNITSSAENTAIATAQVALEVQEVGQSIARMASDANEASEAAQEALEAAQQGQQAVDSTLSGMQAIRREVQSISKRIKSLGDRSLEISEIVDTISRISAQTNLIALNAAIEASGAGSAGSRFAIVADEVRKLAESSSQATGRIAGLIKTVQNEVSEVVSSVEDGTREVEEGYRVASVAGERLKELSEIAQISARFAEQISSGAREQVAGVARVGEAVGRIAQATEQAKLSVLEGKNEAEKLQTLAGQLNENLSRFQLPA